MLKSMVFVLWASCRNLVLAWQIFLHPDACLESQADVLYLCLFRTSLFDLNNLIVLAYIPTPEKITLVLGKWASKGFPPTFRLYLHSMLTYINHPNIFLFLKKTALCLLTRSKKATWDGRLVGSDKAAQLWFNLSSLFHFNSIAGERLAASDCGGGEEAAQEEAACPEPKLLLHGCQMSR